MEKINLTKYGIQGVKEIVYNPSYEQLFEEETNPANVGFDRGEETTLGAVNVKTGIYTGRSPKDKFIVDDETTRDTVWWTSEKFPNDNKPISEDSWAELKRIAFNELSGKRLYVVDTFCGANKNSRLKVRFIMEVAWQAHFVKNMFIRPTEEVLAEYGEPDFVVLNASKAKVENWKALGLNSETAVVFNYTEHLQIILNTWYGGEMKKGLFSYMNYRMPLLGYASMHASANTNKEGNSALFFGLSGTGKTTLSTDSHRQLVGDDEIGWDEEGIFNYEGGCYAKVININPEEEPDIYGAIKRDALLENVIVKENGEPDFTDGSITQNTRVSYPIYHIDNIVKPISKAPAPRKVIFLSADAFGVLPPVSRLTPEQAEYYFLSGFTAKVAGTERGITEPTPTFSPCFGAAFMTLHPTQYSALLVKKMQESGAKAYLVNTGWNGTGKRISLKATRAIVNAIIDESIEESDFMEVPYFNLQVPTALKNIEDGILDPRDSYTDKEEWEKRAKHLAELFRKNFERYDKGMIDEGILSAQPVY